MSPVGLQVKLFVRNRRLFNIFFDFQILNLYRIRKANNLDDVIRLEKEAPVLLYMGHASLRIVTGEDKVIYIDPFLHFFTAATVYSIWMQPKPPNVPYLWAQR